MAILVLWGFYINFKTSCSNSEKNAIGIFIGIALNMYISLGSENILMIVILSIHEQNILFHLFVYSSISGNFQSTDLSPLPRYFMLFIAIVVFLI